MREDSMSRWARVVGVLSCVASCVASVTGLSHFVQASESPKAKEALASTSSIDETLTPQDFGARTQTGLWMVVFASKECSHCVDYQPVIEKVASQYKKLGLQVARIEALDANRALFDQFGIESVPVTMFFKDGILVPQKGFLGYEPREKQTETFLEKTLAELLEVSSL